MEVVGVRILTPAARWLPAGRLLLAFATALSYQKAWSAGTHAWAHSQSSAVLTAGTIRGSWLFSKCMIRASDVRPTMNGWI